MSGGCLGLSESLLILSRGVIIPNQLREREDIEKIYFLKSLQSYISVICSKYIVRTEMGPYGQH